MLSKLSQGKISSCGMDTIHWCCAQPHLHTRRFPLHCLSLIFVRASQWKGRFLRHLSVRPLVTSGFFSVEYCYIVLVVTSLLLRICCDVCHFDCIVFTCSMKKTDRTLEMSELWPSCTGNVVWLPWKLPILEGFGQPVEVLDLLWQGAGNTSWMIRDGCSNCFIGSNQLFSQYGCSWSHHLRWWLVCWGSQCASC